MKKNTPIITALVLVLTLIMSASAETLTKPNALYSYEDEILTISGNVSANDEVTVYVTNPGFTKESIKIHGDTAVQNFRVINATENGKYTYSLKLADPIKGEYTIYVKTDTKEEASTSFVYADAETVAILTGALIGEDDAAAIETLLTDEDNVKYLQLDSFEPFIQADKAELSVLLAEILKDEVSNSDNSKDFTNVISTIRKTAIVQVYNEGKKDVVISGDTFLYEDELGLNVLNENGKTFYKSFKEILTSDVKVNVINQLMGKDFKNADELLKKLAEETVLMGIPGTVGYGHVTKLLTSANCAYINMTYNGINNAQALKIVDIPEQSTITALESEIKKILDDPANSQISVGGGGGAGGTVVSGETSYLGNGNGNTPAVSTPSGKNYFNDIADYEWADEAIGYLYQNKIVSGTGESTFAPAENLTREQFAKVLCILKGIEGKTTEEFSDVDAGQWYAPYIGALAESGLINGIGGGAFGVGYNLSRQDLCVMLYRAFSDKISAGTAKSFTDADVVSDYAKEAVNAMSSAGILNGFTDGSFRPQANCTRAEMAKIIYEVSKLLD